MKRFRDSVNYDAKKHKVRKWKQEHDRGGFRCSHCKQFVVINQVMGTAHRNHCNLCLWSKHVDLSKGDRRATCHGRMEPIGLTFKHEGYGRTGEIMLIHLCSLCRKISINRVARDDMEHETVNVFQRSLCLNESLQKQLRLSDIYLLNEADREELHTQLFGN